MLIFVYNSFSENYITFIKVNNKAILPKRDSPNSLEFSLFPLRRINIKQNERKYVRTGVKIEISPGFHPKIQPYENGLELYTNFIHHNEIYVDLLNNTNSNYKLQKNIPIAKLIIVKCEDFKPLTGQSEILYNNYELVYDNQEIQTQITYFFETSKPSDGTIFPGDDYLIFNDLIMFF